MKRGRYRTRTRIRGRLPVALLGLSPKGRKDCGDHEWYRQDDSTARCYHCEVGELEVGPDDSDILALYRDAEPEPARSS
ncbi:MAG: hypothetical protein H0V29_05735 [Thermoleophilaceae bacterium]|nr:hypothetical protein [Thermoleophilaceae bacterium]